MPVTVDQFAQRLNESGLLSSEEAAAVRRQLPANQQEAKDFAQELVRRKRLTPFQAERILEGGSPPLVLGNYLLLDKIGEGGMGQVFRAVHRRMGRIVALKTLSAALSKSDKAMQRFHREVRAAAKLTHPNIVTAYDADEAEGIHFLVMEYVEGIDLWTLVRQRGPLPLQQAVDYVIQAAQGLAYAHGKGIIHRDIKPSNLLVDAGGTVKVLDLGLARLRADGGEVLPSELTPTGSVMGTVDYLAPEQALSAKTADHRADIYSLGCTLHFLLTGRAIYGGESVMEKLLAHREQPIPSLSQSLSIPPEADAGFRKMVAKRPEERYQSMQEVIAALQSWPGAGLTSVPAEALPPYVRPLAEGEATQSPRTGMAKRRKLLVAGSAAVGFLVVLGLLWITAYHDGPKKKKLPASKDVPLVSSSSRRENPGPVSEGTDAERRAAEWVLKLGGMVKVSAGDPDNTISIMPGQALPKRPFMVREVILEGARAEDIDSGLSHLQGLKGLYYLDLKQTRVTEKGLRYIRRLTSISSLELANTLVTDAALESLQGLFQLGLLNLSGTEVTDQGLAWLEKLQRLNRLNLNGTKITDKGLEHLKGLKSLNLLGLRNTQVTVAGAKAMRAALPTCTVEH